MSKLIPFLFAGVGASSVSVGGVFMLKKTGGNGVSEGRTESNTSGESHNPDTTSQTSKSLSFATVDAFKNATSHANTPCMKDDFASLNISTKESGVNDIANNNKPEDGKFFPTGDDAQEHKSCLSIQGTKTKHGNEENAKWHGKFIWLGTFIKGNEGFISFNVAETEATSSPAKLKLSGVFYLLAKESNDGNIKFKKSFKDKSVETSNIDTHFPKKGTAITDPSSNYGGFMDDTKKLQDVCAESSCNTEGVQPSTETHLFSWTKGTDDNKLLKDWCTGLDGWDSLYSVTEGKLSDKIGSFKGAGTKTNQ